MKIYLILFFVFIAVGLYLLSCEMFHIPTLASAKAVMNIAEHGKKKVFQLNAIVFQLSAKLGKYIKLNPNKKKEIDNILHSAGITMQAKTFIAKVIVCACLKALLIIPFALTIPIMNIIVIAWIVAGIFSDIDEAKKKVQKKREEIEMELPRFVSTISQQLNSNRDILSMLESYKSSAGKEFKNELELTIADMRTGSQEAALTRLETRVRSTMMSETIRGLLAVMHGDNGIMHFTMLEHDFKQAQLQKLKMTAIKRPDKLKVYNYALLGCFFITLLVVIGIYLYNKINGIV
jgi:Flp pilus assembly protein TadB